MNSELSVFTNKIDSKVDSLEKKIRTSLSTLEGLIRETPIQTLKGITNSVEDLAEEIKQMRQGVNVVELCLGDTKADLLSNMNEVERYISSRNETLAKALSSICRQLNL